MFHKYQEKIVFHLLFLLVFVLQVFSYLMIQSYDEIKYQILFIVLNLIVFYGMIAYAKWVWKKPNLKQAFLKTITIEIIFILILAGAAAVIKIDM